MGQINIDKYFKKRLSSYSDDIDTDAIWSDLNLEEEKKNRGIIFWLFGFMSILALLGVFYFGLFTSDHGTTKPTLNHTQVEHYTNNEIKESFKTSIPATDKTDSNEKKITERNNWSENGKTQIINEVPPHSTQQDFNQLLVPKKYSQSKKTKGTSTKTTHTSIETTLNNPKSNQNISLSIETDQNVISGLLLHPLATIDMLDIQLLDYDSNMDITKDIADNLNIEPLTKNNWQPIDINFYSSYNIAKRRLTTDSPSWLGEFIQRKNESETILDAISLGTSMRYNLRSGLYAKLGVEALRITERFNHTQESTETINLEDFIRATRPVTSRWVNFNHHTLISLPLSIGYEKNFGRWSYFVEGGFHLNIHYQFNGLQLDLEGNVTDKVEIEEFEISDTNRRHSYALSAGVRYQMAPKASLYLQPRFQSTFSTNKNSPEEFSTPISQNYNLYGVQFGLSYSL